MSSRVRVAARWVVIPPFQEDAAWRHAVAKAVAAAGLHLHDLDTSPHGLPLNDSDIIVLTSDAHQVIKAGVPPEAVAVLMDSGLRHAAEENPDALPQHIQMLTTLVGRISLLPPERVFRRNDFASGPVEILKGVWLQPPAGAPEPPSYRLRALAEAVTLLDPAQPHATWSPALFNYDSRLSPGGAPGELDLTGRPRFLITGPYIVMPAGRWRVVYRLTFDAAGSRFRFRADWGSATDFVSEEFTPGQAGVFELSQEYDWNGTDPCELRVILFEGVFDGEMTFSGAQVSRVG